MRVGQVFTKIGSFIKNRQTFILLKCNCAKFANFKDFKTCLGGPFFCGHSVSVELYCIQTDLNFGITSTGTQCRPNM